MEVRSKRNYEGMVYRWKDEGEVGEKIEINREKRMRECEQEE